MNDTKLPTQNLLELLIRFDRRFRLLTIRGYDKLLIRQRFPSAFGQDRTNLPLREMRFRRILLKLAHFRKLRKITGNVLEYILALPFNAVLFSDLQIFLIKPPNDKNTCFVLLLDSKPVTKRFSRKVTESNIRQVLVFTDRNNDRCVVEFRPVLAAVENAAEIKRVVKSSDKSNSLNNPFSS